jgi:hypothetical protein
MLIVRDNLHAVLQDGDLRKQSPAKGASTPNCAQISAKIELHCRDGHSRGNAQMANTRRTLKNGHERVRTPTNGKKSNHQKLLRRVFEVAPTR